MLYFWFFLRRFCFLKIVFIALLFWINELYWMTKIKQKTSTWKFGKRTKWLITKCKKYEQKIGNSSLFIITVSVSFSKSDKVTLAKLIVPVFVFALFARYLCIESPQEDGGGDNFIGPWGTLNFHLHTLFTHRSCKFWF